jgi:hypothetical protein
MADNDVGEMFLNFILGRFHQALPQRSTGGDGGSLGEVDEMRNGFATIPLPCLSRDAMGLGDYFRR